MALEMVPGGGTKCDRQNISAGDSDLVGLFSA